jgi:hypothetical protein
MLSIKANVPLVLASAPETTLVIAYQSPSKLYSDGKSVLNMRAGSRNINAFAPVA